MPSVARQVEFAPQPIYCRPARDDEYYVMEKFASHASRCNQCASPYEAHRSGRTLCDRGHQYAIDVAQYVYDKGGKACSLVDRERGQRVQIAIPKDCEVIRDLLKAMERGLKLRRKAPAVSYDETYPVRPRPVERRVEERPEARYEVIEPSREHRQDRVYRTEHSGRGSLFDSDAAERRERYAQDPVYYEARPRVRVREYRR